MAKRVKKSNAWYRAAMLGIADRKGELSPGLRGVAKGFKAADGFNLRDLREGKWTSAQKRKVTMYFHELQELTAQQKVVVKTKSPARLEAAQILGGHDKRFKFKVAFLPGKPDAVIEWTEDNTPIIRNKGYTTTQVPFNKSALAKDADKEVARVIALPQVKKAQEFAIITGENVMMREVASRDLINDRVRQLMAKYDGKKPLPIGSGNRGDKPKHHHWRQWLTGLQAFEFKIDPRKKANKAQDEITRANSELQRRRANERKKRARDNEKQLKAEKGKRSATNRGNRRRN